MNEATTPNFKLENKLPVPPRAKFGGPKVNYPFADMKIGQSFLLAVSVPDSIKDEGEREKAFKEEAKKLSNRISGAIRRFKKSTDGKAAFAVRTVNDDTLGHGVRVWRVEEGAE